MDPLLLFGLIVTALIVAGVIAVYVYSQRSTQEAERFTQPSSNATPEIDPARALVTFESSIFEARGEPKDEQVIGESGIYTINLVNQTCTCPDWQVARSSFAKGNFRRICKHQAAAIATASPNGDIWKVVFTDIKWGLGPVDHFCLMPLSNGEHAFFYRHADRGWCDVVARKKQSKTYDLFGFNLPQRRWSYKVAPSSATEIKTKITAWAWAIDEAHKNNP